MDCSQSLQWPLKVLSAIGLLSSKKDSQRTIIVSLVYLCLIAFNMCIQFMQYSYINGNLFEFVDITQMLTGFGYGFGMLASFVHRHSDFVQIFKSTAIFWKADKYSSSLKLKLEKIMTQNRRFQILLSTTLGISLFAFLLGPLFGRDLPMGGWNMNRYGVFYTVVFVVQVITLPIIGAIAFAYHCIFMACCIEIVIQFKILEHCFRNLNVLNSMSELKYQKNLRTYIQYHVFILRFLKLLQEVYSKGIFIAYLLVTPLQCIHMYATLESMKFSDSFKYGQSFLSLLSMLSIYFITADFAIDEALEVGYAIYDSNWYSQNLYTARKPIQFVIQRSYNKPVFWAGGLFEVNSKALITVIKLSWSACTVMRAVKRNR